MFFCNYSAGVLTQFKFRFNQLQLLLQNLRVPKETFVRVSVLQLPLMVVRLTWYVWPQLSSVRSHHSSSVSHENVSPSAPAAVTTKESAPLAELQDTRAELLLQSTAAATSPATQGAKTQKT